MPPSDARRRASLLAMPRGVDGVGRFRTATEVDRNPDEIGVGANDSSESFGVEVAAVFRPQGQDNCCADALALGVLDGIGDYERGQKPDAELSDQGDGPVMVGGLEPILQFAGTRASNRGQKGVGSLRE